MSYMSVVFDKYSKVLNRLIPWVIPSPSAVLFELDLGPPKVATCIALLMECDLNMETMLSRRRLTTDRHLLSVLKGHACSGQTQRRFGSGRRDVS